MPPLQQQSSSSSSSPRESLREASEVGDEGSFVLSNRRFTGVSSMPSARPESSWAM